MIRALYGGSFDPVHIGHVALVKHLLAGDFAEEVHVVPAWLSPLKFKTTVSASHRMAMAELAFAGHPKIHVDEREIARGAPCFSYDTLCALRHEFPDDQWRLVIGADNLADFHKWYRYAEILACAKLIVVARGGHETSVESLQATGLLADQVLIVADFSYAVSATQLRDQLSRLTEREQALCELPKTVANYVTHHGLYQNAKNVKDNQSP